MTQEKYTGANRIASERERQIDLEGWTPEHDDAHNTGELALAAECYIKHATNVTYLPDVTAYRNTPPPDNWPWDIKWWKPKQPQRDLIRAGALIAAEIDRLDRAMLARGVALYEG